MVVTSRSGKFSSGVSSITETGRVLLAAGEPLRELERPALYERDNQDSLHRVHELGFAYERRWLTSHEEKSPAGLEHSKSGTRLVR